MLQDGVWRGERLLPEGFVDFVSTPAPAWDPPAYGGLFWVNKPGRMNLPESSYYMAGQGGQYVFIVPSYDLVVVRLGHQAGSKALDRNLNQALGFLVDAVDAMLANLGRKQGCFKESLFRESGPLSLGPLAGATDTGLLSTWQATRWV